jgi:hypothetical protein
LAGRGVYAVILFVLFSSQSALHQQMKLIQSWQTRMPGSRTRHRKT